MNVSILIKKIISHIAFHGGIVNRQLKKILESNQYCILMYHRITPQTGTIQSGMYVDPETFKKHIEILNQYFSIIPLHRLLEKQNIFVESNRSKPYCILTFDDGWKDFYDYAYPVLKESNTPATVFLPTNFIDTKKLFWTDVFANLLTHKKESDYHRLSSQAYHEQIVHLDNIGGSYECKLENGIKYLKQYPYNELQKILFSLSEVWQVSIEAVHRTFLDWNEIREMKESQLISFGSHTANHEILTTLDIESIRRELEDSKNRLIEKDIVELSYLSFCYPNGNHDSDIVSQVRTSGYKIAVTTKRGWNDDKSNLLELKRIGMHQDISSTRALFICRIFDIF